MSTSVSRQNLICILLLAALLAAFSYFYLDTQIALSIYKLFGFGKRLIRVISDVPNLLHITVAITALCWTGYFLLVQRGIRNRHTRFLLICGTVVPVAFIAKTGLQYLFGRPMPKLWVLHHELPRFNWFRAGEQYGGFPSGHMTVFTALMTTLARYYPRYRHAFLGTLLVLAATLILTGFHFLSDVIAGAVLGAIIAFAVDNVKISAKNRR